MSFLRFPDGQSTNSVESAVAQNRRSSSSLLNLGTFFLSFCIHLSFVAVHVADRNHSNERPPDRQGYKQSPASTRLPESIVSFLPFRVAHVAANNQWLMKENVFRFLRCDMMPFPIFGDVGLVPFKPDAMLQRILRGHNPSI
jgi:hypothetical protein